MLSKIEKEKSIDVIIDYIKDRIYIKDQPPLIKITKPGDKILLLKSTVGSGKSTVVPTYLYNVFFETLGIRKSIIITQPTRTTTMSIPGEIVKYNKNIKMGTNIGFSTGILKRPVKGINFATVGILLQQFKILTDEEIINKYSFIIMDEIHTRSIEIDGLLFYIKNFIQRNYENPNCPFFILTSGTFDPDVFIKYFDCKNNLISVEGYSHPITDHYPEFDIDNMKSYIKNTIKKIHLENFEDIKSESKFRDIIVFMSNKKTISDIYKEVKKINTELLQSNEKYFLLPVSLTSETYQEGAEDYQNLYAPFNILKVDITEPEEKTIKTYDLGNIKKIKLKKSSESENESENENESKNILKKSKSKSPTKSKSKNGGGAIQKPAHRRVIITTNVIETGFTLPTCKYCIDSGFQLDVSFMPIFGCSTVFEKNVSQASALQRRGRAGRNSPGQFYPCYSKQTFNSFLPNEPPVIIKDNIAQFILSVIISNTETEIIPINTPDSKNVFSYGELSNRYFQITYKSQFLASDLNFIQYPAMDSLTFSIQKLHGLGFIDHEYKPTLFGLYANKFSKMGLNNIRSLFASYHNKASTLDIITIIAFLETGNIKTKKYIKRELNKKIFVDDFIEYLLIFYDFTEQLMIFMKDVYTNINSDYLKNWCENNGLNYSQIIRAIEKRDEIIFDIANLGLNPYYSGYNLPIGKYNLMNIFKSNTEEGINEIINIKKCFYEGYKFNLFELKNNQYISVQYKYKLICDNIKNNPKLIIVNDPIIKAYNNNIIFYGSDISVLDNFLSIDKNVLNN